MAHSEHLEWDSELFSTPVARLLDGSSDELASELQRFRERGYGLVYWIGASPDTPADSELSALGGRFVDRRTTYGRELPPQSQGSPAPGVEAFDAARPTPALQELALEAGVRSRFNIDPKVGRERFEALYSRWIEASVSGELASVCLVSRQAGTETGLVTVEISDDCGRIGLFAVAEPHRRSNLGQGLVQAALGYMIAQGCRRAEVTTQGENLPACQLYEKCGFTVARVERVYHFWL